MNCNGNLNTFPLQCPQRNIKGTYFQCFYYCGRFPSIPLHLFKSKKAKHWQMNKNLQCMHKDGNEGTYWELHYLGHREK